MAISNRDRVGRALDLLSAGLKPYVENAMQATYGQRWRYEAVMTLRDYNITDDGQDLRMNDVQVLLQLMFKHWNQAFRTSLGYDERSYVSLLIGVRNTWAHQQAIQSDEAMRALDQMAQLLKAVSANDQAEKIDEMRRDLLRSTYDGQVRTIRRKSGPLTEGRIPEGLLPWREIATPRHDVAAGSYQMAEFAADLWRVYNESDKVSNEYSDPQTFFERTYLTNGLRQLLRGALLRLSGKVGEPIVELQTNFGGGKTHSLLALYHLFSGVPTTSLVGMEPLLQEIGINQAPAVKRAVLVGHALSPARISVKPDGSEVHTLWGEMAWQLLGRQGYEMVLEDDLAGTSPSSETLRQLFIAAGPTLVLIDEWVVYVRQLYQPGNKSEAKLPAGTFDTNMSFVQSLTEAAKAAPTTLVVASIPASDNEQGGEGGKEAAIRMRHIFGRVESPWRPADPEEGFEIVRRRLFEDISSQNSSVRDAVARAFSDYYRQQTSEFPAACGQPDYERRIKECYPIHPELFDRLFGDWSSIPRFQRTRGVLRLMATVIHELWVRQDRSLLIMPSSIPVDSNDIQAMFLQYLDDNWSPIIDKDIDGPRSLSHELDSDNANLGRYSAARRVARAVFFSATPTIRSANKGIQDTYIKLGCAQPGESVPIFGDALRRLSEQATYLYQNDRRYWYDTQASITRIAQDKAALYKEPEVEAEIKRALMPEQRSRGDFASVHICPANSADIPDENSGVRLVLLRPQFPHARRDETSAAMSEAHNLLDNRNTAPRLYRNTLIFLAPDRTRVEELVTATRLYLAWQAIDKESESLNLDAFQRNEAHKRFVDAKERIEALIPEVYCWVLVPEQRDAHKRDTLSENRLTPLEGVGRLAGNVSSWLRTEEYLITQFAGLRLRQELDRVLWTQDDRVSVKDLVEYFARYVYLPRLKSKEVLLQAIRDGVASQDWLEYTFAYASSWDAEKERYQDLTYETKDINLIVDTDHCLVKPAAALRQIEHDKEKQSGGGPGSGPGEPNGPEGPGGPGEPENPGNPGGEPGGGKPPVRPPDPPKRPTHYYGSVQLNERLMGSDANRIMEAVVERLTSLAGAHVKVTLEINAELPEGFSDATMMTVKENGRTLHFDSSEFGDR